MDARKHNKNNVTVVNISRNNLTQINTPFKKVREVSFSRGAGSPTLTSLKNKFSNVVNDLTTLRHKLNSNTFGKSPDLNHSKGHIGNKAIPKLVQSGVTIFPFCKEYDGYSSRKTKTISESIQAILEEKKLCDQVEKRVLEMVRTSEKRSMLRQICDDAQIDALLDQLDENVHVSVGGDVNVNDEVKNCDRMNNSDMEEVHHGEFIRSDIEDCLRWKNALNYRFQLTDCQYSHFERPKVKGNASRIFACVDLPNCQKKQRYVSKFAVNSNGDAFQDSANCIECKQTTIVREASVGIDMHTDGTLNDLSVHTSFLQKLQNRYVHKRMMEGNFPNRPQNNMCLLTSNVKYVYGTKKLYVTIDRLGSFHALPFAKPRRKIFVEMCLMSTGGLRRKSKHVQSKDRVSFNETICFDLPSPENLTSDSIRFKVYQKKFSKFSRLKFQCVGAGILWLAAYNNFNKITTLDTIIYPYL